jgi:hypothetical protein
MGTVEPDSGESHSIELLPCDTMIVAEGIKFSVENNAYLAFANPNPGNVIIVKGLMQLTGHQNAHVRISGSIDTTSLDVSQMREPWQGIQVKKGGKLIIEHTTFYGARVPIQSESKDVIIKNSFFFDADRLALPDNDIIPISETAFIESFKYAGFENLLKNDEFPISETEINESFTHKVFEKVDTIKPGDGQSNISPNLEETGIKPGDGQSNISPNLEETGIIPGDRRSNDSPNLEETGIKPGDGQSNISSNLEETGIKPGDRQTNKSPNLEQTDKKPKERQIKNRPDPGHTDKKSKNWKKPLVWFGISAAAFGGLATYWIVTAEEPEEKEVSITLPEM